MANKRLWAVDRLPYHLARIGTALEAQIEEEIEALELSEEEWELVADVISAIEGGDTDGDHTLNIIPHVAQ